MPVHSQPNGLPLQFAVSVTVVPVVGVSEDAVSVHTGTVGRLQSTEYVPPPRSVNVNEEQEGLVKLTVAACAGTGATNAAAAIAAGAASMRRRPEASSHRGPPDHCQVTETAAIGPRPLALPPSTV